MGFTIMKDAEGRPYILDMPGFRFSDTCIHGTRQGIMAFRAGLHQVILDEATLIQLRNVIEGILERIKETNK